MSKQDLISVWKLVSYKVFWRNSDKEIYPYGRSPMGYLIYTDNDYVSVHIMDSNRPKDLSHNFQELTAEEMEEIATKSGGYVGRYEIHPTSITHYPQVSTFPDFIHKPQVRNYRLPEPNKLVLECEYPVQHEGATGLSQIIWERVSDPSNKN